MRSFSKDFLISEFWRFYNENGRYPFCKELSKKNGYPSYDAYITKWHNWNDFLHSLGILGDSGWYKCDEQVLFDLYESGNQDDIIDRLMVKRSWGAIKDKARSMGLSRNMSYVRRVFSDEFLISELKRFFETFGKSPTSADFDKNNDYPTRKLYQKRFGTWNNALKKAGLPINCLMQHDKDSIMKEVREFYKLNNRSPHYNELSFSRGLTKNYWTTWNEMLIECEVPVTIDNCILSTKEEGIEFLKNLSLNLNRVPVGYDLNDIPSVNRAWFARNFGSWTNALLQSNLITEEQLISKEESIDNSIYYLKELSNKLNRIPTVKEYDLFIKKQNKKAFSRRELCENLNMTFIELCDEHLDYNVIDTHNGYGNICINNNGKRCRSASEADISNIFIFNNLNFEYEPSYKDLIKTCECRYKFDWSIKIFNTVIYVEYFGLYFEDDESELISNYVNKTKYKIQLCHENNVKLISIYPNDLENGLAGFIDKFRQINIELKIDENLRIIAS